MLSTKLNCDKIKAVIIMKNSNAKKIIFSVVALVVVIATVVAVFSLNGKKDDTSDINSSNSTVATAQSQTTTEKSTAPTTTIETSQADLDQSTETTSSDKQLAVLTNGYWYYYDTQNRLCYVFKFNENENVDLVLYDSDNIDNEDPEYFSGYSTYSLNGDTVTMKNLPDALPQKEFEFTIDGSKLMYGDTSVAQHDELTVDYAIGYFMTN